MPIPQKREDLISFGYVFDNEAYCKACGAAIEWWITPHGKKMPMSVKEIREDDNPRNPVQEVLRIWHFSDCPRAGEFRKVRR